LRGDEWPGVRCQRGFESASSFADANCDADTDQDPDTDADASQYPKANTCPDAAPHFTPDAAAHVAARLNCATTFGELCAGSDRGAAQQCGGRNGVGGSGCRPGRRQSSLHGSSA
jgi:hypothetical protein